LGRRKPYFVREEIIISAEYEIKRNPAREYVPGWGFFDVRRKTEPGYVS